MSSTRLPDPPTPTSQVYAFMQKIKSFGSLSKNLTKLTKKKNSKSDESKSPQYPQQQYENTQFYVRNDYQNIAAEKSKTKTRSKTPKLKRDSTIDDPYQNTEFHSPRTAIDQSAASTSSPLINQPDTGTPSPTNKMFTRKKSKSGKSFKSKFRKSLGPDTSINLGSSFNGTRSTFYISDSVDVDSGVFTNISVNTVDTSKTSDDVQPPLVTISPSVDDESTTAIDSVQKRTKRFSISPEVTQRKSSLTVRPNNPPPPPPVDKKSYKTKRLGTTSWYAECGVFKSDTLKDPNQMDLIKNSGGGCGSGTGPVAGAQRKERSNSSSWYADAGLYQTSGASVASSSGSSGVSTGGECNSADDNSHSMFLNEPLYQIYSAAKLEVILIYNFYFFYLQIFF